MNILVFLVITFTVFFLTDSFAKDQNLSLNSFPVNKLFTGTPHAPVFSNKSEREFRTVLREAASSEPNFAGHYMIAEWGCGAGCTSWAIIDAKDGNVWMAPFSVSEPSCSELPEYCDSELKRIQFSLKSEIIIVTGARNEQGAGKYYYRWHKENLTLLQSSEATK